MSVVKFKLPVLIGTATAVVILASAVVTLAWPGVFFGETSDGLDESDASESLNSSYALTGESLRSSSSFASSPGSMDALSISDT